MKAIYSIALSALMAVSAATFSANAQDSTAPTIRIVGVSGDNNASAQIKARVNLRGHEITNVEAITYNTINGAETRLSGNYQLFDGIFLTSDVELGTESYDYRLVVTLDDGTVLRSEIVNKANNLAYYWLTDFTPTGYSMPLAPEGPGFDIAAVANDSVPDRTLTLGGTKYYKGLSGKGGTVEYSFPAELNIRRFTSRLGHQHGSMGALQYRIKVNTGSVMGFTRQANTYWEFNTAEWSQYTPNLPITYMKFDFTSNNNVIGNFLLPKLIIERTSNLTPQTVTFLTAPRKIDYPQTVELQATSTSGGRLYYNIVQGADAVNLNGTTLEFLNGHNTKVIVEATQYGNDTYDLASATITFDVQTGGKILYSSALPAIDEAPSTGFLYLNTMGKQLVTLKAIIYDNLNNLGQIREIDLLPLWQESGDNNTGHAFPIDLTSLAPQNVFRFAYQYEDEVLNYGPYHDYNGETFEFFSDMPYTKSIAYGAFKVDQAFSSGRININGTQYAKGFGVHGHNSNWIQTNFPLADYSRFCVTVGKQAWQPYLMSFALYQGPTLVVETGDINNSQPRTWDVPITSDMPYLRLHILNGSDGTGNDHGAIGAPRFYQRPADRQPQTLTWITDRELVSDRPCTIDLTEGCNATSGLPVFYRIITGNEYAEIVDGNKLRMNQIPTQCTVVVEAFQPGDRQWAPSNSVTCTVHFNQGVLVNIGERVELQGGSVLDELIVYADGTGAGEAVVKSGLVDVKKFKLRYRFTPNRWHSLCFPSDLDIMRISNLEEKGYTLGHGLSIKQYDGQSRSNRPGEDPWIDLSTPKVKAGKGYMVMLDDAHGTEPVEIEFQIDNVTLDFESTLRVLNLSLDLSQVYAGTEHVVYVKPSNVKGNTLKVIVDYQPSDPSLAPINCEQALRDMRITYAPRRAGIRLVLPDATPAKVAIYSADGRTLIKAVNYIAPNLIELPDVPEGDYNLVIQYGNATTVQQFHF